MIFTTRLGLTDEQSSEFEAIVDFFNKNVKGMKILMWVRIVLDYSYS